MTGENDSINGDDLVENEVQQHFEVTTADEEDRDQLDSSSSGNENEEDLVNRSMMREQSLEKLYHQWISIDAELRSFESKHKDYIQKLDEVESLRTKYRLEFDRYKKTVDQLQKDLSKFKETHDFKDLPQDTSEQNINISKSKHGNAEDTSPSSLTIPDASASSSSTNLLNDFSKASSPAARFQHLSERIKSNALFLTRISDTIPRKDRYLRVILGGVDVAILNRTEKWNYKQDYEKFKFIVTCISLVSSLLIWSLTSELRAFDALFHFLLVWYYCTLTIRESILVANGSNIHPWWRAHHFISTVATGILLTWPDSTSYHAFRTQFFFFSFYLSFVQGLQFYYQRGCLYRLRALGETNYMEVTIEGFQKWMFRGLSFLVPFLLFGYFFQLYNAIFLWRLSRLATTHEWQVFTLAIIFLILFLGNLLTTWNVLREKVRDKAKSVLLPEKYLSLRTFLSTNYMRRPLLSKRNRKQEPSSNSNNSAQSHSKQN